MNRNLPLWYVTMMVPLFVSIVVGSDDVGQDVLNKKVDHYEELGYSVIPAGSFPGRSPASNDWMIISYPFHDILTVESSQEIILEPGTRLFFEPNMRFDIKGSVRGKYVSLSSVPEEHLYLRSLKSETNWRGLRVTRSGRLDFSRVALSGADTLVVSEAPWDSVRINCSEFRKPGACPVSIQDECPEMNDPLCFTLQKPIEPVVRSEQTTPPPGIIETPKAEPPPQAAPKRPVLRGALKWASIGLGAVTVGAGIVSYAKHAKADEYRENRVTSADAAAQAHENYNDAVEAGNITRNVALGAAILSAGFGIAFIMNF